MPPQGWPSDGEFDAILVSAAAAEVPARLSRQLKRVGRLVLALGPSTRKPDDSFEEEVLEEVRFGPFVSG